MQWKHALYALQILRNLLFHGPLAALTEATDGLDRVRRFKTYNDTMRAQNYKQIQIAATEVYNLLVDRAKLFSIRRVCADRRREMKNPPQGRVRVLILYIVSCSLSLFHLQSGSLSLVLLVSASKGDENEDWSSVSQYPRCLESEESSSSGTGSWQLFGSAECCSGSDTRPLGL